MLLGRGRDPDASRWHRAFAFRCGVDCRAPTNSSTVCGVVQLLVTGAARRLASKLTTAKLVRRGDGQPPVLVFDSAAIHHSIGQDTLDCWFREHKALLFSLLPHSRELNMNMIEIVWRHFKFTDVVRHLDPRHR